MSWSKNQEHDRAAAGRVPVIRIGNVQSRLELDDLMYLSGIDNETKVAKHVQKGWTILVGSNGNRARIGNAVLYRDEAELLFASFLVGAKPKAGSGVDPAYFYYWLSSEQVQAYLSASAEGTTGLNNLSHNFLKKMTLPKPPIEEQAAIARILDAADRALQRTRAAIERARRCHHSLLHELLQSGIAIRDSGKGRYPERWKVVRVDEVATVGSGVTLGKDVSGRQTVDLPYLRVANVQDGYIDLTTVKTVRVPVDEVHRFRLESGDVLMTEGGDIDKLGRGTIWEGQIPDCLHQNHIFRIRPNRDLLEPAFYAMVVESDIAKRYFSRVAKRTTNLASTNKTQVRAFRFPLPPTTQEQRQIADVVAQSKSLFLDLSHKETTLRELKSSLMHDLLTGKVRVGDVAEARTL